jgi:hypothetical protein
VQVETAPPLPQSSSKTVAPVAKSTGSSKTEDSTDPDLMPMAPVPGQ